MWSCLPNQPSHVTYILVFDPPGIRDRSGSLLTLLAPTLPFVCRAKESAALVLLAVSACSVVVGDGSGFVGAGGGDELFVFALLQAVTHTPRHTLAREITAHFGVDRRRLEIIEENLLREGLQAANDPKAGR
jgi:hypothetical protein